MTFSERLRSLWKMLILPAVRRLTNKQRRGFSLLLAFVLVICTASLTLLCLSLGAAWSRADRMTDELTTYFSAADADTAVFAAAVRQIDVGRARAVMLTVVCMAVWFVCSVVAVGTVLRASADSETHVFGLYILFGSDRKKLARFVRCEMLLICAAAVLPGICLGRLLARKVLFGTLLLKPLWMLLPAVLLLFIVSARLQVGRLYRAPCITLFEGADDGMRGIASPRRSHIPVHRGFYSSLGTACIALWRMRRFVLSVLLVVCLTSSSFAGLMMLSDVEAEKANGRQVEYTLTFPDGAAPDIVRDTLAQPLSVLTDRAGVDYSAIRPAAQYDTFLLLDSSCIRDTSAAVPVGDRWLLNNVKIICGDGNNHAELGGQVPLKDRGGSHVTYSFSAVEKGTALYVHSAGAEPRMAPSGTVRIPLPTPVGTDHADREYLTVNVTSGHEVPWFVDPKDPYTLICPRITEDYLIISPEDYAAVTGSTDICSLNVCECTPDLLSLESDECLFVVPSEGAAHDVACTTVTVITPETPITTPFLSVTHGNDVKFELRDPYYNINRTALYTLVYAGTESMLQADRLALSFADSFNRTYLHGEAVRTVCYKVKDILVSSEVSESRIVLPADSRMTWTGHWAETTSFVLASSDAKIHSKLFTIEREDSVLFCDGDIGVQYDGIMIAPSRLDPEFRRRMDAVGADLSAANTDETVFFLNGGLLVDGGTILFGRTEREGWLPRLYQIPWDEVKITEAVYQHYPVHINAGNVIVMRNGRDAYSVVSLADCGSGLILFDDQIGDLKKEAIPFGSVSALNSFTVCPAPEGGGITENGLPITPADGHVVVAGDFAALVNIRIGDTLELAIAGDAGDDPEDQYAITDRSRLEQRAVAGTFSTVTLVVDAVIQTDGAPTLILTEADICRIIGADGLYDKVQVSVDPTLPISQLMEIRALTYKSARFMGGIVHDHERVLPFAAAGQIELPNVIKTAAVLKVVLLPLVLAAVYAVQESSRRTERDTMRKLGKSKRFMSGQWLWEHGLTALLCAAGAFLSAGCVNALLLLIVSILKTGVYDSITRTVRTLWFMPLAAAASVMAGGALGRLVSALESSTRRSQRQRPRQRPRQSPRQSRCHHTDKNRKGDKLT